MNFLYCYFSDRVFPSLVDACNRIIGFIQRQRVSDLEQSNPFDVRDREYVFFKVSQLDSEKFSATKGGMYYQDPLIQEFYNSKRLSLSNDPEIRRLLKSLR